MGEEEMKNIEEFSMKNITEEDINIAIKYNATYEELTIAHDVIIEKIKSKFPSYNSSTWFEMLTVIIAYKLGQMQGKREERAKRRSQIRTNIKELDNSCTSSEGYKETILHMINNTNNIDLLKRMYKFVSWIYINN